jgi:polyisoprenoid-binding protein YceI
MKNQSKNRWTGALIIPVLATALVACEDPSVGKPKAQVGSAKPTATATAGASKGAGQAIKLELNAERSKIEWVGSKVTGKHAGGFKTISGSVESKDGKVEGGKVTVAIDMTSIYSDSDKLTGHLRSDDFFAVDKFPKSTFQSTEVTKGGTDGATHTVTGNLTLRGETKSITFPATIALAPDSLTVKAEFSINRKDFGIAYEGKKDDLIRDDVVIKLDLAVPRS